MNKDALRKIYRERRLALPEPEFFRLNQQLYTVFFSCVDLSFVRVLHTFLPIKKNKEPDTWLLVDRLRREFPQIRLSIPRVDPISGSLESFYFDGLPQVQESSLGIPEPVSGMLTVPADIDLVLVPLLAYDQTGHRVGYGKGHYDRFLATCRSDCRKIGLSFFPPVPRIDAIEVHDERLEAVVTPEQYFQF